MTKDAAVTSEQVPEHEVRGTMASISRALDVCRTRIDELLVQLDLAKLEGREEVDHRLARAENAYLAARSKISDTRADAESTMGTLRNTLDQLLHDIGGVYAEVDAAIRRGA